MRVDDLTFYSSSSAVLLSLSIVVLLMDNFGCWLAYFCYRIFRPLPNINGPDFLFLRRVLFFILRSSGVRIAKMKSFGEDAGSLCERPALSLLVVLLRDYRSAYYHCLCLCLFVFLSLVWVWFPQGSK